MAALLEHIDPEGLEEFSVVFTDRSLNHMSKSFQSVMTDISGMLKEVYNADATALIPGGGTYGMEAVARQFGRDAKVLVVRNGWFSYRWSQIFETSSIASDVAQVMVYKSRFDLPQSKMWWRAFTNCARMWFSLRMWKHLPVSSFQMTMSPHWRLRRMILARLWYWTVLRQVVFGSI
jgi:hypothetical protein